MNVRPTVREGVSDALDRQYRKVTGKLDLDVHVLPRNRAEARRYLKGRGPHMRFTREVLDLGDGKELKSVVLVRD